MSDNLEERVDLPECCYHVQDKFSPEAWNFYRVKHTTKSKKDHGKRVKVSQGTCPIDPNPTPRPSVKLSTIASRKRKKNPSELPPVAKIIKERGESPSIVQNFGQMEIHYVQMCPTEKVDSLIYEAKC